MKSESDRVEEELEEAISAGDYETQLDIVEENYDIALDNYMKHLRAIKVWDEQIPRTEDFHDRATMLKAMKICGNYAEMYNDLMNDVVERKLEQIWNTPKNPSS